MELKLLDAALNRELASEETEDSIELIREEMEDRWLSFAVAATDDKLAISDDAAL